MGAEIALSLALRQGGDTSVTLWGRSQHSLDNAKVRIEQAGNFMVAEHLIDTATKQQALDIITYTTHMQQASHQADFIIEAVAEDIALKQDILKQAEIYVPSQAVLSSTTSAIGAGDMQSVLQRPENFVIAHYAQPAHLVAVVEVVLGEKSDVKTGEMVTEILTSCGKKPVNCPDIPGFFWARIQHAILRECVSMVERGLMRPADCDTILKSGYGSRLPAMGSFEHADLAGIDLILSPAAQQVWQDLSNISNPMDTIMGNMLAQGNTGMRSGQGFYNWADGKADTFKQKRDQEIVKRAKINAGGEIVITNKQGT